MSHIDYLIQRYFENTITEAERLELLRLIRSGQVEEGLKDRIEESLRDQILQGDAPDAKEKARSEELFALILAADKPVSSKKFLRIVQYAASLLILSVVGFLLYFQRAKDIQEPEVLAVSPNPFTTSVNNGLATKTIVLADGSTIVLEPGSEVRYAKDFQNDREVFLTGEAFFTVTKDPSHPFMVYANEVTTKVLGTSFRIKANREEKEIVVAVKTGKVSVFAKTGTNKFQQTDTQEITLTPNQQAIYKRSEHVVVKKVVEKPEVIAQRATISNNYFNARVILILKALSESYGVDIQYDKEALANCTLTSDIIESEGLYDQLDIICSALGGTYTLENDASIVIEANGCQ
jgi:hypothetical protein